MNFKMLFLIALLGNTPLLASNSLIIQENGYFTCEETTTFRNQIVKFDKIHWNHKLLTLSCYYIFESAHKKLWSFVPPGGEMSLKEKFKPGTCRLDENHKRLIGCAPLS